MIYRLTKSLDWSAQTLSTALGNNQYHPCHQSEQSKFGWSEPLKGSELLYFAVGKQILLLAQKEEKILPSHVVKRELDARVEKLEQAENRKLKKVEKQTLKERRVINSSIAAKKTATGLIYSDEEELSLVLNGEDHIRLQLLSSGMNIDKLWSTADKFDDYINEKFNYAYSEKLGYLTSYPTNVGTGIRANIVMHLPMLSVGKNFTNLINGISRFGVSIKSVYSFPIYLIFLQ